MELVKIKATRLSARGVLEPCQPGGNAGQTAHTVRQWLVVAAGRVFRLERYRHADDAAVEFRQRHIHGGVQRVQPAFGCFPLRLGHAAGDGLQHRDVQLFESLYCPAGLGGPFGIHFAHGKGGGVDQHAGLAGTRVAQQLQRGRQALLILAAQRGGKQRQRVDLPLGQHVHQHVDEAGVAAQPVGAVEADGHRGPAGLANFTPVVQAAAVGQFRVIQAVFRQCGWRQVAVAGQQQAVGQIAHQLRHIAAATGLQVGIGILLDGRGDGAEGGQFRVRLAGAAEDDQRLSSCQRLLAQGIESGNGLHPAQYAQQQDAGAGQRAVQQLLHLVFIGDVLQGKAGHRAEILRPVDAAQRGKVGAGMAQQHDAASIVMRHCGLSVLTSPVPRRWKIRGSTGVPPCR